MAIKSSLQNYLIAFLQMMGPMQGMMSTFLQSRLGLVSLHCVDACGKIEEFIQKSKLVDEVSTIKPSNPQ